MNEYMSIVAEKARGSNPPASDDIIGADGLRICAKCGEPKETVVNGQKVSTSCRCRRDEHNGDEAKKRTEEIEIKRKACFSSHALAAVLLDAGEQTKAVRYAKEYVEHWAVAKSEGTGLLLWGDVGSGKSYIAAGIANGVIDCGSNAKMISVTDILIEYQDNPNRKGFIDELCRKPLLVIDDLGAERDTAFGTEAIYAVINKRYETGKPMIITTNIPLKEMRETKDYHKKRIYDRILEVCVPVFVDGNSRRPSIGADRTKRMRKLLGVEE